MIDQERRQIMDRMQKQRTVIFIIILFLGCAACAVALAILYLAVSQIIPAVGR